MIEEDVLNYVVESFVELNRYKKIITQALRYWNIQRGYDIDGSIFDTTISDAQIEIYAAQRYSELSKMLSEEWILRGNELYPKEYCNGT